MYSKNLHFHFIGIGGTGMSGLAEILVSQGFSVSGSDMNRSDVTTRLERLGITVAYGHDAENIPSSASLVVFSSAIPQENVEMQEALSRGLPTIRRAEVLAELMRLKFGVAVAGAHGKTTTTSLIAWILEQAKLDPTVVIGGIVKSIGTGGKLGLSDYLVAESDESDKSFLLLTPSIAVVTNIDSEHLSAYKDFDELLQSFTQFIGSVPFYGVAICCTDDEHLKSMIEQHPRRSLSYGLNSEAALQATNITHKQDGTEFTATLHGESLGEFFIPLHGVHMVQNALASILVAKEFDIELDTIRLALACFPGVKRRMELLYEGSSERSQPRIFSDYAHHPTEIAASISALQQIRGEDSGRIRLVFQPHRYSRLRDCFDQFARCFVGADEVSVCDVHAAGETTDPAYSSERLAGSIEGISASLASDPKMTLESVFASSNADDIICCFGAGSIGKVAEQVAASLREEIRPTEPEFKSAQNEA